MLVGDFNETCNNIAASYLKVGYESMSASCFCTTSKENLPNLSYIFRNPEPLGIEFKTVAYYITGSFLLI